jgi:hypothetical protein
LLYPYRELGPERPKLGNDLVMFERVGLPVLEPAPG